MNKDIKQILTNSPIKIKYKNIYSWEINKEINNLFDFCKIFKVKISKKGEFYNLKINCGNLKITQKNVRLNDLENNLVKFVKISQINIGDVFTVKTNFRTLKNI